MSVAWKFELGEDQGIKWAQKEAYCRDIPEQTIPHLVFGLDTETKSEVTKDIFRIAKNLEKDLFADGSPAWPDSATPTPLPLTVFGPAAAATGIEFSDQISGTGTKLTIFKITSYSHSKFDTRLIFDAVLKVKATEYILTNCSIDKLGIIKMPAPALPPTYDDLPYQFLGGSLSATPGTLQLKFFETTLDLDLSADSLQDYFTSQKGFSIDQHKIYRLIPLKSRTQKIWVDFRFHNESGQNLNYFYYTENAVRSGEFRLKPGESVTRRTLVGVPWAITKNGLSNTVDTEDGSVGDYGGECVCPDGSRYWVGAVWNQCKNLACVGGVTSGECDPHKKFFGVTWSKRKVFCHTIIALYIIPGFKRQYQRVDLRTAADLTTVLEVTRETSIWMKKIGNAILGVMETPNTDRDYENMIPFIGKLADGRLVASIFPPSLKTPIVNNYYYFGGAKCETHCCQCPKMGIYRVMDDWSDKPCAEVACEAGDRITCPDNADADKSIKDSVVTDPELKGYNDNGSPVEYSISHLQDGEVRAELLAVRARHKEEHILDIR
jgi:hypothetical protein